VATQKQRETARKNVKKAQSGARQKRTISNLWKDTRSALGREGAKAAARKRGASKGTGTGAGAMTVTELRREAARLGIEGRSKMGKAQLIRGGRSEAPVELTRGIEPQEHRERQARAREAAAARHFLPKLALAPRVAVH
jgi:hypothetical protein